MAGAVLQILSLASLLCVCFLCEASSFFHSLALSVQCPGICLRIQTCSSHASYLQPYMSTDYVYLQLTLAI